MAPDASCLLLHGFTGSPFEMQPLADALTGRGVRVACPVLPGHAETVEAMDATTFSDWYEAARRAYDELAAQGGCVFVAGLSMGGSLALRLAERHDVAGVAAIAAPVFLYSIFPPAMKDLRLPFVRVLRRLRSPWPMPPPDPRSREIAPWKGYDGAIPLNALCSLLDGLKQTRRDLERIRSPLLLVYTPRDKTVPVQNAHEIFERAASTDKQLELLEIKERITGHHLLTTHRETSQRVARLVADFVSLRAKAC